MKKGRIGRLGLVGALAVGPLVAANSGCADILIATGSILVRKEIDDRREKKSRNLEDRRYRSMMDEIRMLRNQQGKDDFPSQVIVPTRREMNWISRSEESPLRFMIICNEWEDDGDGKILHKELRKIGYEFSSDEDVTFLALLINRKGHSLSMRLYDDSDNLIRQRGEVVKSVDYVMKWVPNDLNPGDYSLKTYLDGTKVANRNFSIKGKEQVGK